MEGQKKINEEEEEKLEVVKKKYSYEIEEHLKGEGSCMVEEEESNKKSISNKKS